MKGKIAVITLSIIFAFILLSTGYGLWNEKLIIEGHIEVVEPEIVIETISGQIEPIPEVTDEPDVTGLSEVQEKGDILNKAADMEGLDTQLSNNDQEPFEDSTPPQDSDSGNAGLSAETDSKPVETAENNE